MLPKEKWLTVFHRAVYENVPDAAKAILDTNPEIGLPSSDAWMARLECSHERHYECVLEIQDIVARHGFKDPSEWPKLAPYFEPAAIWIPRDDIDCKSILRDLAAPEHPMHALTSEDLCRLESILFGSIGDPSKAIYAVRTPNSRKTLTVMAYERNLVFADDTVQLNLEIEAFHSGDYITMEAALFAAFHEQTATDLEGAVESMGRAGLTPKLSCALAVSTPYLRQRLSRIIDATREHLFHVEDADGRPHVDITLFGAWLSGSNEDDYNHILIREPISEIPST